VTRVLLGAPVNGRVAATPRLLLNYIHHHARSYRSHHRLASCPGCVCACLLPRLRRLFQVRLCIGFPSVLCTDVMSIAGRRRTPRRVSSSVFMCCCRDSYEYLRPVCQAAGAGSARQAPRVDRCEARRARAFFPVTHSWPGSDIKCRRSSRRSTRRLRARSKCRLSLLVELELGLTSCRCQY
jgi:hypothetical protein